MLTKRALFMVPVAIVLVLLTILALVPVSITQAKYTCSDTIYVNGATGDDNWAGTQPTGGAPNGPKQTIQAGIKAACPDGGTVYVAAGIYYEHLWIPDGQNLVGAGAPVTIIDGGGTGRVIRISSDPTDENLISGFTIQNGDATVENSVRNNGYYASLGAGINIPLPQLLPQPAGGVYIGCQGGGIFTYHITTIEDCTIRYNHACLGGGVYSLNQLTMKRTTVYNNTADWGGGGIFNGGLFHGAIPVNGPGPQAIDGDGDGIEWGQMWLTNCTISGNSLTGEPLVGNPEPLPAQNNFIHSTLGAGILNSTATMTLLNCTVAFNHTNDDMYSHGGGFANVRAVDTAYFKNTIVANNTAGDGVSNNGYTDEFSTTISQGNNLDSENSCGFNQPSDKFNTDPQLGPLQDNGGPTFTHAIPCNSPAYNTGTNTGAPPTDQRGVTRPQNGITDIGAYEAECTPPVFVGETDQSTGGEAASTTVYSPSLNTNNLAIRPSQTVANRPVTITANVVNEGGMTGSTRVALKINGQVEQTKLVTVGPGGSRPVKFTVTKAEPGTYTVIMGSQRASFLVTEDTKTSGLDTGTIVMILLGIVVVAFIMVIAFSFGRKPSN